MFLKTLCLGIIWAVVCYDVRCCQYLVDFPQKELNPLAKWIIFEIGVWDFLAVKIAGAVVVTECLRRLKLRYSIAVVVIQLFTIGMLLS